MNKDQKRNIFGFLIYLVIAIVIFYITNYVFPKSLANGGYSGEDVGPKTNEMIKPLLFLIPIMLSFYISTVFYFLKFKRFNKFVFPIMVINTSNLVFWLGTVLHGVAFVWFLFIIIPVSFLLFFLGIACGWILDNRQKYDMKFLQNPICRTDKKI